MDEETFGFQRGDGSNLDEFLNYRDLDIPRNITLKVLDSATINLFCYEHPLKNLMTFPQQIQKITAESNQVSFELLYNTMKKGYAMYLHAPEIDIEVNNETVIKAKEFDMELSVVFRKKVRKNVHILKDMFLDIT